MTPQATRKAMSDLYRECNPFEPARPATTVRAILQDLASLISLAVFVIAAALVAISHMPAELVV